MFLKSFYAQKCKYLTIFNREKINKNKIIETFSGVFFYQNSDYLSKAAFDGFILFPLNLPFPSFSLFILHFDSHL